jgi:hypothetical protein
VSNAASGDGTPLRSPDALAAGYVLTGAAIASVVLVPCWDRWPGSDYREEADAEELEERFGVPVTHATFSR